MKSNINCCICKKPIYKRPSDKNGHNTCSYSCRNKYFSGERSFAYKHGKYINGKRDKIRDRKNDKLRRIAYKEKAIKLLGGKCIKCGYSKCIASLDFHHKNLEDKDKNIKDILMRTWLKVEKELKKCILLCSNCHRELHWEENNE